MKENLTNKVLVGLVAVFVLVTAFKSANVSVAMPDGFVGSIEWAFQRVADGAVRLGSAGNEFGELIIARSGIAFGNSRGGGVLQGNGEVIRTATTTCAFQSPTDATSTLVSYNAYTIQNATTTAREVSVATSTNRFATTSPILDGSLMVVTPGAEWSLSIGNGSTTPGNIKSRYEILPPSTWIVTSFKGGTPPAQGYGTTTDLQASCSGLFMAQGL